MMRIGRSTGWLLALILFSAAALVRADISASVDRDSVALGDTLVLTLTATDDEDDLQAVDTTPLSADFDILSRNLRSSTSIINGARTQKRELSMEIAPRRSGKLTVPALGAGKGRTRPIRIEVTEAPQVDPGSETVLFDAEVDRGQVYVQGQLLLTLRIQQSISLDRPSITELHIPDAFVVPLEQKSFQRRMQGRLWLVQEVRYAIFPEHSGTLEIPAQQFSAREGSSSRSLFDPGSRGRLIRRSTDAIRIEVLPKPATFPADADWLPAQSLAIEEKWSQDPAQLRAGESVTRTLHIRGEGLQGAQLPPVLHPPTNGLKFYPDQPQINDAEVGSGLMGERDDSVAIVPTESGTVELPAIEIPWWDTTTDTLRKAVIPARTLHIAAAAASPGARAAGAAIQPESAAAASPAQAPASVAPPQPVVWQAIALFCALGWVATLYLLLRRRENGTPADEPAEPPARPGYRNLLAACASNSALQARASIINWADGLAGERHVTSLAQVRALLPDAELSAALEELDAALYGGSQGSWDGGRLRTAVERLHKSRDRIHPRRAAGEELALYPAS